MKVLLVDPGPSVQIDRLAEVLARELRSAGAQAPRVQIEVVPAISRTWLGKMQLIKASRNGTGMNA